MATFKATVRGECKDGFLQVYIRVTHHKRHGYIKTDKMVTRKELTKTNEIKDPFVIPMAGLDPEATYRVTELNRIDNTPMSFEGKTFSGKYLMSNGLAMPLTHNVDYHKLNDWASRILLLEKI